MIFRYKKKIKFKDPFEHFCRRCAAFMKFCASTKIKSSKNPHNFFISTKNVLLLTHFYSQINIFHQLNLNLFHFKNYFVVFKKTVSDVFSFDVNLVN